MKGKLFIVSAPSGAGKNTLVNAVFERMRPHVSIKHAITYTSRIPRPAERNGIDYHFLTESEFERRIAQGFFLEWSNAYGTYYGSPASLLEDMAMGISVVLIVDRVGAQHIKGIMPDAILIWITVPGIEILRQRLQGRGTEDSHTIERRLQRANIELALEKSERLYGYHIMNDIFLDARSHFLSVFVKELSLFAINS